MRVAIVGVLSRSMSKIGSVEKLELFCEFGQGTKVVANSRNDATSTVRMDAAI